MWENIVELLFYKEQQSVFTYYTYLPSEHTRNHNSGKKFENFETWAFHKMLFNSKSNNLIA
jgi:hypothetical protein